MTKQHNMGRGSRLAEESQLQQNMPDVEDLAQSQPTRPSVHGRHVNQDSKKEPAIKPSRRHRPVRIM